MWFFFRVVNLLYMKIIFNFYNLSSEPPGITVLFKQLFPPKFLELDLLLNYIKLDSLFDLFSLFDI